MSGTLKVGGNIIASHSGVEGAGEVTLQNVTLGDSAVPSRSMNFRNKIINGNFDIWQRGTSQTNSGYGSVDRWQNSHSVASTKTASQQAFTVGQTEVPGNPKYYLRNVVTTGGGAGDTASTQSRVEGVESLSGKTATLSFWAKADSNKSIATEFVQYFGSGGSPSAAVNSIGVTTHNLTTSWQKFTATVSIPSISGKTIGSDGNDYLRLQFWFDSGSTYSARNNSLGNQSGTFDIAQVQVEEGSVPTPFEHRPYGIELSLCQRYYQKFGNLSYAGIAAIMQTNITTLSKGVFILHNEMRSGPSISFSNLIVTDRINFDTDVSNFSGSVTSPNGIFLNIAHASSGAVYRPLMLAVKNLSSGFLAFESEL